MYGCNPTCGLPCGCRRRWWPAELYHGKRSSSPRGQDCVQLAIGMECAFFIIFKLTKFYNSYKKKIQKNTFLFYQWIWVLWRQRQQQLFNCQQLSRREWVSRHHNHSHRGTPRKSRQRQRQWLWWRWIRKRRTSRSSAGLTGVQDPRRLRPHVGRNAQPAG